jgi:hypothetical protein
LRPCSAGPRGRSRQQNNKFTAFHACPERARGILAAKSTFAETVNGDDVSRTGLAARPLG